MRQLVAPQDSRYQSISLASEILEEVPTVWIMAQSDTLLLPLDLASKPPPPFFFYVKSGISLLKFVFVICS